MLAARGFLASGNPVQSTKLTDRMAALHLVQEAKLDLDTDVNRYLKRCKAPDNRVYRQD
jgi:hypothetical protein